MLPSQCAICAGWGLGRLCEACVQRFAAPRPRCRQCGIGVVDGVERCGACVLRPPPFERTIAALDYDHPWDDLVRRFKFDAALDLASALAQRLLAAVRASGEPAPDWLLPVPLSPARGRDRGYNQAWELARRIGPRLRCAADARLLLRVRDTPHQLALPPAERAANVRGAFAVEPRRLGDVRGRRVAIVDDVMTTGATAAEIAATLRVAGAAAVQLWVLARTPSPQTG